MAVNGVLDLGPNLPVSSGGGGGTSGSSSTSGTAAFATAAGTASTAGTAAFATVSGTAAASGTASTAGTAAFATVSGTAAAAGTASTAGTAAFATNSGSATSAGTASTAGTAAALSSLTLDQVSAPVNSISWSNGTNAIVIAADTIGAATSFAISTSGTAFTGLLHSGTSSGNAASSTGFIYGATTTGAANKANGYKFTSAGTDTAITGMNQTFSGTSGAYTAFSASMASGNAVGILCTTSHVNFGGNLGKFFAPSTGNGNNVGFALGRSEASNDCGTINFYKNATAANSYMQMGIYGQSNTLIVDGNGRVGIGTNVPSTALHTSGGVRFASITGASANLIVDSNGNVTASSDERLKDIESEFTRGLESLAEIQPINYKWKKVSGYETENTYTGFSAQNVQESIPEAVSVGQNGFLAFSDRAVIATLVNAVNELSAKIKALEKRVR